MLSVNEIRPTGEQCFFVKKALLGQNNDHISGRKQKKEEVHRGVYLNGKRGVTEESKFC